MPANSKSILIKFISIGRGLNKTSLILVDQGVIEFVSNPKSFIDNKDVGQSGFFSTIQRFHPSVSILGVNCFPAVGVLNSVQLVEHGRSDIH